MSKFVTYPAVTVLDNDHSLLIDSPSAGTNSITAENAGNTLLSKWAGFETFDEAVQNTIEHNQKFIDRDTAIREETAELKKKIVTTFPAKEASGAVATFESEFEDAPLKSCIVQINPVQDLHGYDSPWPAGGGKNKIPNDYNFESGTTKEGVTATINADGSIRVVSAGTGTATAFFDLNVQSNPNIVLPAGTYSASGTISGKVTFAVKDAALNRNLASPFTLTEETGIFVYLSCYSTTAYDVTIYPQIESGSTATTYAPYSNICPISGWTGAKVTRTGKNLCGVTALSNVGWALQSIPIKNLLNSLNIGTYTISFEYSITSVRDVYTSDTAMAVTGRLYGFVDGITRSQVLSGYGVQITRSQALSGYSGKSTLTFDITAANKGKFTAVYFYGLGRDVATEGAPNGVLGYADITNIQLELGSTATPYEPYTGQTYPITFPSEAGTVYGGYVDPINGELVVDRAMIRLSSDMSWLTWGVNYKTSGITGFYIYRYSMPSTLDFSNIGEAVLTNILEINTHVWGGTTVGYYTNTYGTYRRRDWYEAISIHNETADILSTDTNVEAIEKFKAFLESTPLNVLYKLAEPIHYPLTPTEIKTLLGQNNIWANTGDTTVEYLMSDVSWYVEKKLRALQSILAGVEDSSTASKNYSANTYLIFNDDIYRVTKAITAGETIEEGVNVTKTTVAEQLLALAQA